jgi:pimeloyl-ACP methyl ester carboxylesterase
MHMTLQTVSGFAPVADGELYYEVAGAGTPIVLTHAGVADHRMWDGVFEALAGTHMVVRYDTRGFLHSSSATGPVNCQDDVRDLLRHLRIERAHVAGISMGGYISLSFATAYPEMTRSLVLIGAHNGAIEDTEEMAQVEQAVEAAIQAGDLALANELELRMWVDGLGQPPTRVEPALREKMRVMNLAALAREYPGGGMVRLDPPAHTRLGEIAAPTLIMVGDLDVPPCVESAEFFAAGIRGSRTSVYAGVAHMLPMEAPERFATELLAFVAEVDAAEA